MALRVLVRRPMMGEKEFQMKDEVRTFLSWLPLMLCVCGALFCFEQLVKQIELTPHATPEASSPRCFDLPPMCSGVARPVCICGFYSVTCRWECAQ